MISTNFDNIVRIISNYWNAQFLPLSPPPLSPKKMDGDILRTKRGITDPLLSTRPEYSETIPKTNFRKKDKVKQARRDAN